MSSSGGPGADRLQSFSKEKTVINGGTGHDVLNGGPGRTLINAKDGKGGDKITCRSARNLVLADRCDKVSGPCRMKSPLSSGG
jgi:hypothetical protein